MNKKQHQQLHGDLFTSQAGSIPGLSGEEEYLASKGIDWSQKDMYDGIGRPDLRPKNYETVIKYNAWEDGLPKRMIEKSDWD